MGRLLSATFLLAGLAACAGESAEPTLAEVKAAAERYRDVKVAIAEGYTTDNKCVTAEALGRLDHVGRRRSDPPPTAVDP